MSILNHFFDYKPEVLALDEKAMELCQPYFRHMEEIRDFNQLKMLKAFADTQMSSTDMLGTTGYGLWDTGRAKLEHIFAEVMGAEDALVRSQFQSGTHTLAVALFGLLRAARLDAANAAKPRRNGRTGGKESAGKGAEQGRLRPTILRTAAVGMAVLAIGITLTTWLLLRAGVTPPTLASVRIGILVAGAAAIITVIERRKRRK